MSCEKCKRPNYRQFVHFMPLFLFLKCKLQLQLIELQAAEPHKATAHWCQAWVLIVIKLLTFLQVEVDL